MKKLFTLSILPVMLITGLFLLNSCSEKESVEETIDLPLYTGDNLDETSIMDQVFTSDESDLKCGGYYPEICGEAKFYPLIASKKYYVGALMVYNDEENLYVTYWSGWWMKLTDFHLYIGDANEIPLTNKGNPKFGHFPYKDEVSATGFKTFIIPLSDIPECYTLVAHAVFGRHTVLAFGETPFSGSRWGWSIEDCVEKCESIEYDYYTLKLWFQDETGASSYALIDAAEQYYHEENWCDEMGVVKLMDTQTLNLNEGNSKIGEVNIIVDGDKIKSTITLNAGLTPTNAYAFYGTPDELDSYGACPNYYAFPYSFEGNDALEFEIPLQ